MTAAGPNYGWLTSFAELLREDPALIRQSLERFVRDSSKEQRAAWDESIPMVRDAAARAVQLTPAAQSHAAIFEYELPREGGRRPDTVVLGNGAVVVVEFKGKDSPTRADLDQVSAYARDLRGYHSSCHDRAVLSVLVPERYRGQRARFDDVEVVAPRDLGLVLAEFASRAHGNPIDAHEWASAEYAPLPSLIQAARDIFNNRPLPFIRKAQSAGIPAALEYLVRLAHEAAGTRTRKLALLTGVPGAGKTLVGLQFVHARGLDDLVVEQQGRPRGAPAVFLSGNGPLVRVLRHALQGPAGEEKVFVDGIKSYLKQYVLRKKPSVPPEHILVFDEAQRAWDADMIEEKHGTRASEPDLVLEVSSRIPDWSLVLGLVGEGQEIHKGEEGGIAQWVDAITKRRDEQWVVHGPPKLEALFVDAGISFVSSAQLDLTTSMRSHHASLVHEWVAGLLQARDTDCDDLRRLADTIWDDGFKLYLTRDLGSAASYVRDRYAGQPDKRYGLVASARSKNLEALGIDNSYNATKQMREGPWYNDSPSSPFSCCQLRTVATEFAAQGLELDTPIVCWGDDLVRKGGEWYIAPRRLGKEYKDPSALRINSYRVLLTRGRDGLLIFVPPDRADGMDETARFLEAAGLRAL